MTAVGGKAPAMARDQQRSGGGADVTGPPGAVGVVGLGYVGLPTAIWLAGRDRRVVGLDIDEQRLLDIRNGRVDLLAADRERLHAVGGALELTTDPDDLRRCDAVIVCVPTPVDDHRVPDLGPLRAACTTVVERARAGQLVILTSTSYAGTTADLIAAPLRRRGLVVGRDVFVAFSPERIDPANVAVHHTAVTRVVGGVTPACTRRAAGLLRRSAADVRVVSSPEAAELCKLLENSFRAVNISLANELADIARALHVDPIEVIDAAATKPYGFMAFRPGPGVGGHCIPCDPHYLRWQMRSRRVPTPVLDTAMEAIARRPALVLRRIVEMLSVRPSVVGPPRVLVVGVAYKPNVADVRESPAIEIIEQLVERGIAVDVFDPVAVQVRLRDGTVLRSLEAPEPQAYDLVLAHTVHDRVDHEFLRKAPSVVDATYRLSGLDNRVLL